MEKMTQGWNVVRWQSACLACIVPSTVDRHSGERLISQNLEGGGRLEVQGYLWLGSKLKFEPRMC